jgi:hypothetical protein
MTQHFLNPQATTDDPTHAFKLDISHAVHVRGSITVWLTWNRLTGRPVMVLTPTDMRGGHERITPCVIPIDRAWLWDEDRGDLAHANITAAIFCANLGFSPENIRNIFKVQGYIRDYLEDLIRMPPMPPDHAQIVGEALIFDNETGRETYKEIADNA